MYVYCYQISNIWYNLAFCELWVKTQTPDRFGESVQWDDMWSGVIKWKCERSNDLSTQENLKFMEKRFPKGLRGIKLSKIFTLFELIWGQATS